jgi:hypothetical protein
MAQEALGWERKNYIRVTDNSSLDAPMKALTPRTLYHRCLGETGKRPGRRWGYLDRSVDDIQFQAGKTFEAYRRDEFLRHRVQRV